MAACRKTSWSGEIFTLFFLMQICVTVGLSAEIRVPYDYITISEALAVADNNDTILVAPGTYSDPNESFPLRIQKAVILMRDPNDQSGWPHLKGDGKHTVVLIESGGVTLQGFRITEGSGSEGINSMDGGGICVFVGPGETRDVNIVACLIENNTCPSDETYDGCGGGIYCGGTYCECFTVNVSNCVIRNNSTRGCGGGVFCALLSIVDIIDTYVEDNTADDHGGGVFVDFYASIDMNDTHLLRNNCPGDPEKQNWGGKGGGLACESLGIFTATDCSFGQNTAKHFGGGIFTRAGLFDVNDLCSRSSEFPYVLNSLIQKNRADVSGGGVYVASNGILDFSNTTLYWNDAGQDGGAVFVAGGATGGGIVDFNDGCILEGNECAERGGGIYLGFNALGTFEFTHFLGNSALFDGGAVFLEEDASSVLTECLVTYNNSARGYAGGIRAASQSWLDLVHCSIVGNFAPRKRSGLYLDPNSVVNIRDSILWRNAGGSIEANGATVNINDSLSEDGADPNNGVLCCDPQYVGWGDLKEIYVDAAFPGPGAGTSDDPYCDLQMALNGFNFHLAENSLCVRPDSDRGNLGADTGVGGSEGSITAKLHLMDGTYDIRGRNIIFTQGIRGTDPNTSVIRHAILGYVEDAFIKNLGIMGEEIFGGITLRASVQIDDCYVAGNTALVDGGGIYVADGNCVMTDSLILGNTCLGGSGGGIYASTGTTNTVTNSVIISNDCLAYGAGLFLDSETVSTVADSNVLSNTAHQGAGIYVSGRLDIIDSNIVGNSAIHGRRNKRHGGGIYVSNTADVGITGSRIISNYASRFAGGLMCLGKTQIDNSRFETNTADYGGAIDINPPGTLLCQECIFKENKADGNGGVLYASGGAGVAPVFLDCEFTANSARHGGVGRCYGGTSSMFERCSFTDNAAVTDHGGCFYLSATATRFHLCTFSGSEAKYDGGIAFIHGDDISLFESCDSVDSIAGRNGGAFYITGSAQPMFSKVNIVDGWAKQYGGGIAVFETAKPAFADVNISDCNAVYGGGLYAAGSSVNTFQQCKFLSNWAYDLTMPSDGGGAYFTEDANGWFTRCELQDNYAQDDGGGMGIAERARVDLWNTLFAGNTAMDDGGGIHLTSHGAGMLTNCTLTLNNALHGGTGAGIYLETNSIASVDSSIICLNRPDGIRPEADPNVNYSCTQKLWPGLGNLICEDCCMLDPNTFELQDGSPCIDAGNPDPNMNDGCQPPGKGTLRNDMGITGGPENCFSPASEAFSFNTFIDPAFLVLRGSAAFTDGILRLTEANPGLVGGAWYALPAYVQEGFDTTFDFQIDRDSADGFAFVIQNVSPAVLGWGGSSQGYGGIRNSLAVEFDTWRNGGLGDPNDNHVSVQTRGLEANSCYHTYSLDCATLKSSISDNKVHTVKITYTPGELSISIFFDDDMQMLTVYDVFLENILSLMDGHAFVGFTAATGGGSETHDILRWLFVSTAPQ